MSDLTGSGVGLLAYGLPDYSGKQADEYYFAGGERAIAVGAVETVKELDIQVAGMLRFSKPILEAKRFLHTRWGLKNGYDAIHVRSGDVTKERGSLNETKVHWALRHCGHSKVVLISTLEEKWKATWRAKLRSKFQVRTVSFSSEDWVAVDNANIAGWIPGDQHLGGIMRARRLPYYE